MPNGSEEKPDENRICVLASSGLDSALMIQAAINDGKAVFPLYVASGFLWEAAEVYWLKRLLKELAGSNLQPLKVVRADLKPILSRHFGITGKEIPGTAAPDEAVYIPGRNLFLSAVASVYCAVRDLAEIWIGTLKGNPFADGQAPFFSDLEKVFSLGLAKPLKIRNPFGHLSKAELVQRFPGFPYRLTFSCLKPIAKQPCRACNKCAERLKVLGDAAF